jgi:predicted small lipoprotein YifL
MKAIILVLMVCCGGVVCGCGQKGGLYLPDKNASVVTRPAGSSNPAPAQPTPAPAQHPQDKDKDKGGNDSASSKPKT